MRVVKGFFSLCVEKHRANNRQKTEVVTAAINKLKENHNQAMLTIEDLDFVMDMLVTEEGILETTEDEHVRWFIDDDDEEKAT